MNPDAYRMAINGEYRDRGMRKWRAFASIPEQYTGLKTVFNDLNYEEKPLLSSEQMEIMNDVLIHALQSKKSVYMVYYAKGRCVTEKVKIQHVDNIQSHLFFIEQKNYQKKCVSLTNLVNLWLD